jgi:hypothetical protein
MKDIVHKTTQCFTQSNGFSALDIVGSARGKEWNSTHELTQSFTHRGYSVVIAIVFIVIVIACI